MSKDINIAIFASGAGSNAEKIIEYFKKEANIHVKLIVTNRSRAGVLQIAAANNVESLIIHKDEFLEGDACLPLLKARDIDYIVLAGFLWKIPSMLIDAFEGKIINIHPALLPKYGGKGMYGHFVHAAVIENKEQESGITIHLVDNEYDHGAHLFQTTCKVDAAETPESLAQKVHSLEHSHFAEVIKQYILQNK